MTFDELRVALAPIARSLEEWATCAEADQFAPWVVGMIRESAALARLPEETVWEWARHMQAAEVGEAVSPNIGTAA